MLTLPLSFSRNLLDCYLSLRIVARASMLRTNERGKHARKENSSSLRVYLASLHLTLMVNNLSISFDVIFRSLSELRISNLSLNEDSITLVIVPRDYH